jgi:putative protein-disulfide isomerase
MEKMEKQKRQQQQPAQNQQRQKEKRAVNSSPENHQQADLEIIYYTDPLCCWSWGFEPQWRKLSLEFEGKISYRYCMGGLLPAWKNFNDTVNSVTRPIQMGPVWMHASQMSGMPVDQNVWIKDPPQSSYPACIAVKCAAFQSGRAAGIYLRLLREAIMIDGENIAKQQVLLSTATRLSAIFPGFNIEQFKKDLKSEKGIDAFRKDLQEIQYHKINRFPSLVIKKKEKAVIISGYRPYPVLLDAIRQVAGIEKTHAAVTEEMYKQRYPSHTDRELLEIKG